MTTTSASAQSPSMASSERPVHKKKTKSSARSSQDEAQASSANAAPVSSPAQPAEATSAGTVELVKEDQNPYMALVSKRLRALKKRLLKIEKYESDVQAGKGQKLNEDQRAALEKKEDVAQLIREFEDVYKQMEERDVEEQKLLKKTRRAEHVEKQKSIQQAVNEAKKEHREQLRCLLDFFFAINIFQDRVPNAVVPASQKQALTSLYHVITGSAVHLSENYVSPSIEETLPLVQQLLQGENVPTGFEPFTFADLRMAVQEMVNYVNQPPPAEPQFTLEGEDAADESILHAQDLQHELIEGMNGLAFGVPLNVPLTFGNFEPPTAPPPTTAMYDLTSQGSVFYDPCVIASSVATPPPTTTTHGGVVAANESAPSQAENDEPATAHAEVEKPDHVDKERSSKRPFYRGRGRGGNFARGSFRGNSSRGNYRGGRGAHQQQQRPSSTKEQHGHGVEFHSANLRSSADTTVKSWTLKYIGMKRVRALFAYSLCFAAGAATELALQRSKGVFGDCPRPPVPEEGNTEESAIKQSVGPLTARQKDIVQFGLPQLGQVRYMQNYVSMTSYKHRQPLWVLEHLTADNLKGSIERDGVGFIMDQDLHSIFRTSNDDYLRSGYSRGHMAPASHNKTSAEAMKESFRLSSNIVPQDLDNNMFYWNRLEKLVRSLTDSFEEIWVVSGPLWLARPASMSAAEAEASAVQGKQRRTEEVKRRMEMAYPVIGESEVPVPTHLYKVLLAKRPKQRLQSDSEASTHHLKSSLYLAAFILPNGHIPDETPLTAFQVPLEMLSFWAGVDFFPELNNSSEQVLDLCRLPGQCQLMDAHQHRMMQLTRSLRSCKQAKFLDRVYSQLKETLRAGEQLSPDIQHLYEEKCKALKGNSSQQ